MFVPGTGMAPSYSAGSGKSWAWRGFSRPCAPGSSVRTCVRIMVVSTLYPRFELLAALGDRRALVSEPVALAPEAGREQVVGEVSAPAEAFGVVRGMRLGEAMSRCPALRLVPPD